MGIAALRVLPDRPEDAPFLTPDERRLVREQNAGERRERETRHLLPALKDPRVLVLTCAQFGFTAGSYGVGIWLPQLMKAAQLSNVTIGFLTGLAAAGSLAFINSVATLGGFVGPYAMGWLRDATGSFSAGLMAMAALLVLATLMSWSLKLFVTEE